MALFHEIGGCGLVHLRFPVMLLCVIPACLVIPAKAGIQSSQAPATKYIRRAYWIVRSSRTMTVERVVDAA
jgi:hypothetical protein